jgi:hypothetical protein
LDKSEISSDDGNTSEQAAYETYLDHLNQVPNETSYNKAVKETEVVDEIFEAHGKKRKIGRPKKIQGVTKKIQKRKRNESETTSDDSDNSDMSVVSSWGSTPTSRKREFSDEERKTSDEEKETSGEERKTSDEGKKTSKEGIVKHEKNKRTVTSSCSKMEQLHSEITSEPFEFPIGNSSEDEMY